MLGFLAVSFHAFWWLPHIEADTAIGAVVVQRVLAVVTERSAAYELASFIAVMGSGSAARAAGGLMLLAASIFHGRQFAVAYPCLNPKARRTRRGR